MAYLGNLEIKSTIRKITAGAVICGFMLSTFPNHAAAFESGGGVGFFDRDPSLPDKLTPRELERFRELFKINPLFYGVVFINFLRTGRLPPGFFSGVG